MKNPVRLNISSPEKELWPKLQEQIRSNGVSNIAGIDFVITACSVHQRGIDAELTEFRRVDCQWNGEGLPPVGTVCEFMKHNSPPAPEGQWTVGDIRYVSDCYVIIGGDGCEHAHHPRNCSFRPVRTPEQIARLEKSRACDEMFGVILSLTEDRRHNRSDICEALYDAGYRKQVRP